MQIAILAAICVPIGAGGAGVLLGPGFVGDWTATASQDSHFRYLSGLLVGIGLCFAATVPRVEAHAATFRLLTTIVFIGGLARLLSLAALGAPSGAMLFGLAMELVVTPALCLWQNAHARRAERLARP
ncbi:MAG: DUF4345 domain-containing protein [Beijerinckiaceae bacterium]|nr:DUF4345 domain-containing protein [Beijerinckiaceae bacterium]